MNAILTPKQIRETALAIKNAKTAQVHKRSILDVLDEMAAAKEVAKQIAKAENIIAATKRLAMAEHKQTAMLNGYIKAIATTDNPLQTELDVFITSFTPNKNKQGVRKSEAKNIIKSALNSPLKINFETLSHAGASVVGSITAVEDTEDRITGRAVIWKDIAPDVDKLLKSTATLGTSWEIYYADSSVDSAGTSWLTGCVFAGLCVVSSPAYGTDAAFIVRS